MSPGELLLLSSSALLSIGVAVSLFNLLTAPRLEAAGVPRRTPPVSLLVPVRNEEENVAANLPSLLAIDYPSLEILVLDDESEDETAARVEALAQSAGGRLRLLRGAPLPAGWLGKNWACHQLADAARGEVLLFCDADVSARPDAVARTMALLERSRGGAVTALPRQRLGSWAESAVVPLVVNLPVLALLPIRLVSMVSAPSLSMANGQWLAFTRAAYDACGGHRAVRAEVVEDVALGRRIKAAGFPLTPAVASRTLAVRMYSGMGALREGFGKNLYPLVGGRPFALLIALPVFFLVAVYPWVAPLEGGWPALLPLLLLAAIRLMGLALFRHPLRSVVLHPLGSLLLLEMAVRSFLRVRRGTVRWKGREVVGA